MPGRSNEAQPLPRPNSDFYQLVEVLTDDEKAVVRKVHTQLPLSLHVHELIHRQHIVIKIRHDNHRSKDDESDHEDAKGEGQYVVGGIGRSADVQEEH